MRQFAENGRIGICHSLRGNDLYIRVFSGGYPYINNGTIVRSSKNAPIYSYGKNYVLNDKEFALFMWTTEEDSSVVENIFDNTVQSVTEEQVDQIADNSSFVYLD